VRDVDGRRALSRVPHRPALLPVAVDGDDVRPYRRPAALLLQLGHAAGATVAETTVPRLCELIEHTASARVLRWYVAAGRTPPRCRCPRPDGLPNGMPQPSGRRRAGPLLDVTPTSTCVYLAVAVGDAPLVGAGSSAWASDAAARALDELIQSCAQSPQRVAGAAASWPGAALARCVRLPLDKLRIRRCRCEPTPDGLGGARPRAVERRTRRTRSEPPRRRDRAGRIIHRGDTTVAPGWSASARCDTATRLRTGPAGTCGVAGWRRPDANPTRAQERTTCQTRSEASAAGSVSPCFRPETTRTRCATVTATSTPASTRRRRRQLLLPPDMTSSWRPAPHADRRRGKHLALSRSDDHGRRRAASAFDADFTRGTPAVDLVAGTAASAVALPLLVYRTSASPTLTAAVVGSRRCPTCCSACSPAQRPTGSTVGA